MGHDKRDLTAAPPQELERALLPEHRAELRRDGQVAADLQPPGDEGLRGLELLGDACETNRALMMAGLRLRFPGASEAELHGLLMRLLWGEAMATRIWGSAKPDQP